MNSFGLTGANRLLKRAVCEVCRRVENPRTVAAEVVLTAVFVVNESRELDTARHKRHAMTFKAKRFGVTVAKGKKLFRPVTIPTSTDAKSPTTIRSGDFFNPRRS